MPTARTAPAAGTRSRTRELRAAQLECPGCEHSYDVQRAGRCVDAPELSLMPLPLLEDDAGHGEGGGRASTGVAPAGTGAGGRARAQRRGAGALRAVRRADPGRAPAPARPLDARAAVRVPPVQPAVRPPAAPAAVTIADPRAPPAPGRLRARATPPGRSCASPSTWPSSSTAAPPSGWSPSTRARWARPSRCSSCSAWEAIEDANPVLAGMEPDVEALLVNRARGARDSLARADRRLLRAGGPDPHALAGPDGRQGGVGGDRALLRCARPALTASRGQRGDDHHMSTSYPYLKVGKPDVKPDAPSHTPGIKQGNSKRATTRSSRATCRTAAGRPRALDRDQPGQARPDRPADAEPAARRRHADGNSRHQPRPGSSWISACAARHRSQYAAVPTLGFELAIAMPRRGADPVGGARRAGPDRSPAALLQRGGAAPARRPVRRAPSLVGHAAHPALAAHHTGRARIQRARPS